MPSIQERQVVRPHGFAYLSKRHDGRKSGAKLVLYGEGVPLTNLAGKYGTPLYAYSSAMIRERFQTFDQAFADVPHTICYSVKANSNLSILRMLAKLGCGFDVVSGGELERVLKADRKASRKVVFSGVGKTRPEMISALKGGILLFNVESEAELSALSACAARVRKKAPIAFRVNPDVAANTHPYISTGLHKHKFGVPIREARALYSKAAGDKNLSVRGVSVHIGSQITDVSPFGEAISRVADFISQLRNDGHQIDYIDAGGGLGIPYEGPQAESFADRVGSYANAIIKPIRGLGLHLLLEPGRSIIGPAGVLLTTLLYRKRNESKQFLVVDAAMNDLVRPALYGAHHEILPVVKPEMISMETADVVGPICESGDFLARDRQLPVLPEGSLLAVLDTGAYGYVLSSNYNTRPRPAEILVTGKSVKVIRRREKVSDLMRAEL